MVACACACACALFAYLCPTQNTARGTPAVAPCRAAHTQRTQHTQRRHLQAASAANDACRVRDAREVPAAAYRICIAMRPTWFKRLLGVDADLPFVGIFLLVRKGVLKVPVVRLFPARTPHVLSRATRGAEAS